jgi:hypothetical protein
MLDLGSRGHGALLCFFRREWEISALQHGLASELIRVRFFDEGGATNSFLY